MSNFPEKTHYEGVRFNVISVMRGCVGVQFPRKKRYVTLEWPLVSLNFFKSRNFGLILNLKCISDM